MLGQQGVKFHGFLQSPTHKSLLMLYCCDSDKYSLDWTLEYKHDLQLKASGGTQSWLLFELSHASKSKTGWWKWWTQKNERSWWLMHHFLTHFGRCVGLMWVWWGPHQYPHHDHTSVRWYVSWLDCNCSNLFLLLRSTDQYAINSSSRLTLWELREHITPKNDFMKFPYIPDLTMW